MNRNVRIRRAVDPAPEPAPLRRASRVPVVREQAGSIHTHAETRVNKRTVHEEARDESVARVVGEGPLGRVRVGAGKTIGLPAFSAVRFDVAVELPCTREDFEEVYQEAVDLLVEKMTEQEKYWNGAMAPSAPQRRTANRRG